MLGGRLAFGRLPRPPAAILSEPTGKERYTSGVSTTGDTGPSAEFKATAGLPTHPAGDSESFRTWGRRLPELEFRAGGRRRRGGAPPLDHIHPLADSNDGPTELDQGGHREAIAVPRGDSA